MVKDVESSLRVAINAFESAAPDQQLQKAKSVRNLTKRLLSARLRQTKARLVVALEVGTIEARNNRAREIESLRERAESLRSTDPLDLLREFTGEELADSLRSLARKLKGFE